MPRGPKLPPLTLSDELQLRGRHCGLAEPLILARHTERVGASPQAVGKWRRRFLEPASKACTTSSALPAARRRKVADQPALQEKPAKKTGACA